MKKLIILLAAVISFTSCDKSGNNDMTSADQDMQMLQSKYLTVYRLDNIKNNWTYICIDSVHVYKVRMYADGKIESTVKIK